MNRFFKKLNEPFPEQESIKQIIKGNLIVAIFVTLFLYLIQPFGVTAYPGNMFWLCASFGFVTFIAGVVFNLLVNHVLGIQKDVPSWTLWKWIFEALFLVLFIGIANYILMNYIRGWSWFGWWEVGYMLFNTFLVGIFPIIFSGMLIQIRANKHHLAQAKNIQTTLPKVENKPQVILLSSQKNTQILNLPINNLFYLESMQNYVSICYSKDGKLEKTLFRITIKEMVHQLSGTSLIRCHRSFIVNTNLIEKVAGNAQGLRLGLKGLAEVEIPVSRKYIPKLKAILK